MQNILISGDPMRPMTVDIIAQLKQLEVGKPVPEGWRVLSGNERFSTIARVAFRYEIEENR